MRALKSIGSKYRIMPAIRQALLDLPGDPAMDLLVDVFGGSGTVIMNSGFTKRVYNDADGDLVNFFRVLRDDALRPALLRRLRHLPMSREEYEHYRAIYVNGGNSFHRLGQVDRAVATYFRSNYSYGGKMKNGGFSVSASDRNFVKENATYLSRLRDFKALADFWRKTVIEHGDFQKVIELYGNRANAILYCDPPYFGTEGYYSRTIEPQAHTFLAEQLNAVSARAVVSYYRFDGIEEWYPPARWEYRSVNATKNCLRTGARKTRAEELLLLKRI